MTLPKNFVRAGIIGLGMFIAYKIISKGSTLKNLALSISKINYTFSGSGLILTVMVNVENIKDENILINNIDVDLYFNNNIIGSANNDLNIVIPSLNSVVVPVSVQILYQPVIKLFTDLISGKMKELAVFNLRGSVKVEDILFPLDLKYSML
jgi:hypothetical protein